MDFKVSGGLPRHRRHFRRKGIFADAEIKVKKDESGYTAVLSAAVEAEGERIASVGRGFLLLLGVTAEDDEAAAARLAKKAAELRIFEDETGRMNRSVRDIDGSALVVSNFTLCADCRHGRAPGNSCRQPGRRGRSRCTGGSWSSFA